MSQAKQAWIGLLVTAVFLLLWWPLGVFWAFVWWFDDVRPILIGRRKAEEERMAKELRRRLGYED